MLCSILVFDFRKLWRVIVSRLTVTRTITRLGSGFTTLHVTEVEAGLGQSFVKERDLVRADILSTTVNNLTLVVDHLEKKIMEIEIVVKIIIEVESATVIGKEIMTDS